MQRGFSIIELLVVMSIIAVIGSVSVTSYNGSRQAGAAKRSASVYADALKEATTKARTMEFDTAWGVRILANQIVVFSGNTYASRITARDRSFDTGTLATASGPTEIVFAKFTAVPSTTGTTTFSNTFASSSVYVLSSGVIGE